MSKSGPGLYGSEYNRSDWYLLKEVLLGRSRENVQDGFCNLPVHLQEGPVGVWIQKYLASDDTEQLDSAIALMAPGMRDVYLLLEKS